MVYKRINLPHQRLLWKLQYKGENKENLRWMENFRRIKWVMVGVRILTKDRPDFSLAMAS